MEAGGGKMCCDVSQVVGPVEALGGPWEMSEGTGLDYLLERSKARYDRQEEFGSLG